MIWYMAEAGLYFGATMTLTYLGVRLYFRATRPERDR